MKVGWTKSRWSRHILVVGHGWEFRQWLVALKVEITKPWCDRRFLHTPPFEFLHARDRLAPVRTINLIKLSQWSLGNVAIVLATQQNRKKNGHKMKK